VAGLALLDRRLLLVTGKGGVGKSTVSAALALLAARRGKRVLVAEVNVQERVAPLLGAPPAGPVIRAALPGISTVNVDPQHALEEYGLMVLKYRAIYHAVFENRVVKFFLRVIPSLPETLMLGKILHEARAEQGGHPRWDLVVVDAPATGHAVQLFRVPSALLDTVPGGPMRRDAEWMHALLTDPERTALSIVAMPEEMPVSETIDLDVQVREVLRIPRGPLFLNAMPDGRFSPAERERLGELQHAPPPLGPAAHASLLQAERAEQAQRHAGRLAAAVDLPTVTLPLIAVDRWGREAVERIADAMDGHV
jgi:energy-coupling factor transporter ATP-binding protein EcfA2